MKPRTRKPTEARLQAAQQFQAPLPTAPTDMTPDNSSTAVTMAFGTCGRCKHYAGRRDGGGFCVRWQTEALPKLRDEPGCLLRERMETRQ